MWHRYKSVLKLLDAYFQHYQTLFHSEFLETSTGHAQVSDFIKRNNKVEQEKKTEKEITKYRLL